MSCRDWAESFWRSRSDCTIWYDDGSMYSFRNFDTTVWILRIVSFCASCVDSSLRTRKAMSILRTIHRNNIHEVPGKANSGVLRTWFSTSLNSIRCPRILTCLSPLIRPRNSNAPHRRKRVRSSVRSNHVRYLPSWQKGRHSAFWMVDCYNPKQVTRL